MRLMIVGSLNGQLGAATKIALDRGAKVVNATTVHQAMAELRAGRGADLLMVEVSQPIAELVKMLAAERIHVPIVACGIGTDARAALLAHPWRGNVRELENTIHRAVLLARGPEITEDAIRMPDGSRVEDGIAVMGDPAAQRAAQTAESISRSFVGRTVSDMERDLILETLSHCLGNRTHAANILGISIRTLRNKLKEYTDAGVKVPPPGANELRVAV